MPREEAEQRVEQTRPDRKPCRLEMEVVPPAVLIGQHVQVARGDSVPRGWQVQIEPWGDHQILRDLPSLFVQIFARNVVFGYLTGANFLPIAFSGVFDARYDSCLERVPFFQQLVNTFRIDIFDVGQALQISRLQSRTLPGERGGTWLSELAPTLPVNSDLALPASRFRQRLLLRCGFPRTGFPLRRFL